MEQIWTTLINGCCMASLENQLEQKGLLPIVWWRYVDDVFAKIKKNELINSLNALNAQFPTVNFTYETETDNKLLFGFVSDKKIGQFDRIRYLS